MFMTTNGQAVPEDEPIMSPTSSKSPACLATSLCCAAFALGATVWMGSHWLGFYSWCRTAFGMAILHSCGLGG